MGIEMMALTLYQPWATGIFRLNKKIETRSWKTSYRGRIAIHASKAFPRYAREFAESEAAIGRIPNKLPFGAIIGFVNICDIQKTEDVRMRINSIERLYGDYSDGRYAWILSNFISVEPIPCDGHQRLWKIPDKILEVIANI